MTSEDLPLQVIWSFARPFPIKQSYESTYLDDYDVQASFYEPDVDDYIMNEESKPLTIGSSIRHY